MQEAILDNFELKLPHRTNDATTIKLIDKELCNPLAHQLIHTLDKLFLLHGVGILNVLEKLRRETRQPSEVQRLTLCQRITNLKVAGIGQSYNISGIGIIHNFFLLSHKSGRGRKAELLIKTDVTIVFIAFKTPRTNLDKSDTAAVIGIHIGMDLEDKSGERLLTRLHNALFCLSGLWRWCNAHKTIEQLSNTKVIEGRTEENRSQ